MSDDLIKEFLVESYENLDKLDQALVALEQDPRDAANLASIFRTVHTIKGTCGFLGFGKLEAVTHVGENLLSRLRDGALLLDEEITTGLLQLVDGIRALLAAIEQTGAEDDRDYSALVAELTRLNQAPEARVAPATVAPPVVEAPVVAAPVVETVVEASAPVPAERRSGEDRRQGEDRRSNDDRRAGDDRRGGVADTSLRVDVGLLDKLMTLVGELVLARNQILQFTATQRDSSFLGATQRLNLVTSELQEGVMKTRMQPIDNVWSKFPRVVRDLAVTCGKRVRIEMVGKDTELDKTIIEAIKDPLTHVVRNSVDHGIEPPEVRQSRGKHPEGVLTLRAFHEGGQINIEITDDGGGIDPETVRRKAIERGLVTAEAAARLAEHDVLRFIFMPGFSTAATISNVSGRGVGMDVVKTNVERIGGTVDIQSRLGSGTTIRIKIPLTLAIIPALMVSTGGERFAIPQVNLVELVRLEGDAGGAGIESIQGARFYRLRGNLLPIVALDQELALQSRAADDVVNIVVLRADGRQFGLVVDTINDTEEIVVKPLGKLLKTVQVFAGATIMGDGHVALILDVLGLAQQARVLSQARRAAEAHAEAAAADNDADAVSWLLFAAAGHDRLAIPLDRVDRLEEFAVTAVERSAGREVVQYRGEIMPLVYFGGDEAPATDGQTRQAIVFASDGRRVALVVDRIVDITTQAVTVRGASSRPGILGAAVIADRVSDLVDLDHIVASAGVRAA
ncbi:MAG: chemotaxis protein CheW [Acidobacteria bacterium]|nr:chemotaxis protein CheW [Acidobacteriota bacterium]